MGRIVSDKLCRGFCSHTLFFFLLFPFHNWLYIHDVIFAALGAFLLLLLLIILEGAVCGLVLAGLGSIE